MVLGAAFALGGGKLKHNLTFAGLVILLVSLYIAVPGSIWWGRGNWEVTLYHTVWMTPFLLLYLIDKGEEVFLWLIPLLVLHSGVLVYQEVVGKPGRQMGLLDNPNPAGALLAIGTIYILNTRFKWFAPLLAAGLVFTGSRSAFAVFLLVFVGLFLSRFLVKHKIDWKPQLLTVLVVGLILLVNTAGEDLSRGTEPWTLEMGSKAIKDLGIRLEVTDSPSFLPKGITYSWGLHSLPERISVELGITAAVVWVFITLYSLVRKPRYTESWWILLTIALLSISEYSVWLGPLAALWWLTIGVRSRYWMRGKSGKDLNSKRYHGTQQTVSNKR